MDWNVGHESKTVRVEAYIFISDILDTVEDKTGVIVGELNHLGVL